MKWLRGADQIQILAVNGESFVFNEIPADIRAVMNEQVSESTWIMQDVEGENRNHMIDFVGSLFYETDAASGCIFRPHHYVIGSKGPEVLILHLCFECGKARTVGAIEREGYIHCEKLAEVSSIFGIAVDRISPDNRITFFPPPIPKPKQTWPVGGNLAVSLFHALTFKTLK